MRILSEIQERGIRRRMAMLIQRGREGFKGRLRSAHVGFQLVRYSVPREALV